MITHKFIYLDMYVISLDYVMNKRETKGSLSLGVWFSTYYDVICAHTT